MALNPLLQKLVTRSAANYSFMDGMPLVAVKVPKATCNKIMIAMSEQSFGATFDYPDVYGTKGLPEFSLIMMLATIASNIEEVGDLRSIDSAEFFDAPCGPMILLSEKSNRSGAAYLIAPRPCDAICSLLDIMSDELQTALNREDA
jgi:hypothetical protein